MQILYIYDLKAKDKKSFNRAKRLFYYHLNKLPLKKEMWRTKSALAVSLAMETTMDRFFRGFRRSLKVYKAQVEAVEEL